MINCVICGKQVKQVNNNWKVYVCHKHCNTDKTILERHLFLGAGGKDV